jgi:hypothetical protein
MKEHSETGKPEPQSSFWTALEWLFYARAWDGWRRALFGYLLILALLGAIWTMVLITASDDLYVHPGMMWGLVVIASPASLLLLLALSRLLLAIKEPLILLTKFVLTGALLLFGIWLIVYVLPLVFPGSRWAYSLRYNTDLSRVHVAPKPSDCDFFRAPLGFKGCHYQKSLQVARYKADVRSGQWIISYNDGKTWNQLVEGEKPGPPDVYVNWERLED